MFDPDKLSAFCDNFIKTGELDQATLGELKAFADAHRGEKPDGRRVRRRDKRGRIMPSLEPVKSIMARIAEQTGVRPRGRPRIHPLTAKHPDFIGPKRPSGRPRKFKLTPRNPDWRHPNDARNAAHDSKKLSPELETFFRTPIC